MNKRERILAEKEGCKPTKLYDSDYLLGVYDETRMDTKSLKEKRLKVFLNCVLNQDVHDINVGNISNRTPQIALRICRSRIFYPLKRQTLHFLSSSQELSEELACRLRTLVNKMPWRNDEGFVIVGIKYFLLNADGLEY